MVDRYAGDAFASYQDLRRLSAVDARAELELLDDLVLIKGLHPDEADGIIAGSIVITSATGSYGCVPTWLL